MNDRELTNKERSEIYRRKSEMEKQKESKAASLLSELKKELGLSEKERKK